MHKGMKEMFDKYDVDKSGKISFEEFSVFLEEYCKLNGMLWMMDEEAFKQIFDQFDTNNSGTLNKYEMRPLVNILIESGFLKSK